MLSLTKLGGSGARMRRSVYRCSGPAQFRLPCWWPQRNPCNVCLSSSGHIRLFTWGGRVVSLYAFRGPFANTGRAFGIDLVVSLASSLSRFPLIWPTLFHVNIRRRNVYSRSPCASIVAMIALSSSYLIGLDKSFISSMLDSSRYRLTSSCPVVRMTGV